MRSHLRCDGDGRGRGDDGQDDASISFLEARTGTDSRITEAILKDTLEL